MKHIQGISDLVNMPYKKKSTFSINLWKEEYFIYHFSDFDAYILFFLISVFVKSVQLKGSFDPRVCWTFLFCYHVLLICFHIYYLILQWKIKTVV